IAERLAGVQDHLPPAAWPTISSLVARGGGVTQVAIVSDTTAAANAVTLRAVADSVRLRLLTAPGVAAIAVSGGREPAYRIVVSPDRLEAYDITLQELVTAARTACTSPLDSKKASNKEPRPPREGSVKPEDIASLVAGLRGTSPVRI